MHGQLRAHAGGHRRRPSCEHGDGDGRLPGLGGCATDDDNNDETIPARPGINIDKEGALVLGEDGVATVGDLINYTFVVKNTGNVTLTNVTVTDPLVARSRVRAATRSRRWGWVSLRKFTGSYAITQADIDAGHRATTATATGDCPALAECATDDDDNDEPLPARPGIKMVKEGALVLGEDGVATVGDLINYTFVVKNTGNVTLTNVTVTDPLVASITCPSGNPIPTLGVGEICGMHGQLRDHPGGHRRRPSSTTWRRRRATARLGGVRSTDDDDHDRAAAARPGDHASTRRARRVALQRGRRCATLGELINYTFTVKNTGQRDADECDGDATRWWHGHVSERRPDRRWGWASLTDDVHGQLRDHPGGHRRRARLQPGDGDGRLTRALAESASRTTTTTTSRCREAWRSCSIKSGAFVDLGNGDGDARRWAS